MKNRNLLNLCLLILLSITFLTACDSETPKPSPTPEPQPMEGKHFDLWIPIAGNAGMRETNCVVKRVASLDEGVVDIKGTGVDLSEKLFPHTIIKDGYYYQISKEKRFGKYKISENRLETVKEIPFTTLKERRYTHTWLDDKTLVLMGANGSSDKILWIKIDAETMRILSEGALDLPAPNPDTEHFNTSGLAAYRKSDNTILYSFNYKSSKKRFKNMRGEFYMAFINPSDMAVKEVVSENRAEFMASTAYGELRQDKSFFDENDNYYIACNSVLPGEGTNTAQHGALLRVNNGTMEFDKSFNGYNRSRGKIITVNYLNNGKAILYMQDPEYTTQNRVWSSKTNPYVFYWLVVDLNSGSIVDLKDEIPFSNGNFSQLAVIVGNKAYLGVNPENAAACFYIYDIPTGKVTKGLSLAEGYKLDRVVLMKD